MSANLKYITDITQFNALKFLPILQEKSCDHGQCQEICISGFQGGGAWYLGTLFRRKYFVEFDVGARRVGFAKAIHNKIIY